MAPTSPPAVTWPQVLAWRMRRQRLDPLGAGSAVEIARLSGAHRSWEKGSWQKTFGATPADLEAIAAAATEALDGAGSLTREQLTTELIERTGSDHLREVLGSGWGTLLKPLAWWGVLCHGPSEANRVTFASPSHWVPGWRGLPALDDAAPVVIRGYLGAHGPATLETFDAWLSRGLTRRPLRRSWFEALADELVPVEVEGEPMWMLAADLDELLATDPSGAVRLVGGFDQYVLGAGTNATYLVPAEHRSDVSRTGGWISPVVLYGGRVVGVWRCDDGIDITLWEDVPRTELERETARMRQLLDAMA